ncbi:MAG: hypothetical protein D6B25_16270 [Desulfobulbaceae bacterium]|nr:MAG: hypothetical protein D6B25_16270 [Desulfobulbaceae bacterium]
MRNETRLAISNEWSHCSYAVQRELIKAYIDKYGGEVLNGEHWFEYLAEAFGIYQYDFTFTHKTKAPWAALRR